MSFETMLKVLLEELKLPEGQKWVDIAELLSQGRKIDSKH